MNERLAGLEHRPSEAVAQFPPTTDGRLFPEFWAQYGTSQGIDRTMVTGWVCTGAVSYAGQEALQQDIDNLEAGLEQVEVTAGFLPVVAPASVWGVRWDGGYYDLTVPPRTLEEYRAWAERRIDALNHALHGLPEERIRYHICWGSFNAPHMGDVPLREIVDLVLKVNAGAHAIEMANPRHAHEWRLWEDVTLPEGKILIPGVISHSTNVIEHPDLVAERLVRLAKLVGRESLMAGTDCGFAQGPLVQRVHASIQWAKLRSLAEGAALASRELWGARAVSSLIGWAGQAPPLQPAIRFDRGLPRPG